MGEELDITEDEYKPLKGEGEVKFIKRTQLRQNCEACGEAATKRYTYLLPNARRNPASKAYGRDDCTWCSNHEIFGCDGCKETEIHALAPEGLSWCSTFDLGRFPHMGLFSSDKEIPDPAAFMADTYELLDRLETYFDQRSDVVDGDYGVPEPNAEMQHLNAIRELMAAMEKNNG